MNDVLGPMIGFQSAPGIEAKDPNTVTLADVRASGDPETQQVNDFPPEPPPAIVIGHGGIMTAPYKPAEAVPPSGRYDCYPY